MLNRNDSLTLQLLVFQPDEKITVNGHVQGLKRIEEKKGRAVLAVDHDLYRTVYCLVDGIFSQSPDVLSVQFY